MSRSAVIWINITSYADFELITRVWKMLILFVTCFWCRGGNNLMSSAPIWTIQASKTIVWSCWIQPSCLHEAPLGTQGTADNNRNVPSLPSICPGAQSFELISQFKQNLNWLQEFEKCWFCLSRVFDFEVWTTWWVVLRSGWSKLVKLLCDPAENNLVVCTKLDSELRAPRTTIETYPACHQYVPERRWQQLDE